MQISKIKPTKEIIIAFMFIAIIFFTMISILIPTVKETSKSIQKYFKDNVTILDKFDVRKLKKEAKSIKKTMETYSDQKLYGRLKYIEIYGMFNKMIDNYLINEEVVKLNNGYLSFITEKFNNNITNIIENYVSFNNFLKAQDVEFIYIQAPSKNNKYDQQLPSGIVDYGNSNADSLLAGLSNKGVDIFDLREVMNEKIDDYYGAFFRTDHHWKPETGLWAAEQVAKRLNEKYNFNFNLEKFDISNYNVKVYEKYFLGSQGKKVGLGYVKPDDFSMITPNWDTNITLQIPSKTIDKTGRFEDVLINYSQLGKIDYYNKTPYGAYLYGNVEYAKIKNNLKQDGKKILMIRESFSLALVPFLIDGISEIDLIDLRYYKDSVREYIEQNKPDVVIMMYNSNYTLTDKEKVK